MILMLFTSPYICVPWPEHKWCSRTGERLVPTTGSQCYRHTHTDHTSRATVTKKCVERSTPFCHRIFSHVHETWAFGMPMRQGTLATKNLRILMKHSNLHGKGRRVWRHTTKIFFRWFGKTSNLWENMSNATRHPDPSTNPTEHFSRWKRGVQQNLSSSSLLKPEWQSTCPTPTFALKNRLQPNPDWKLFLPGLGGTYSGDPRSEQAGWKCVSAGDGMEGSAFCNTQANADVSQCVKDFTRHPCLQQMGSYPLYRSQSLRQFHFLCCLLSSCPSFRAFLVASFEVLSFLFCWALRLKRSPQQHLASYFPRQLASAKITRLSSRQSAAGSIHRQDSTCPNPPMPQSAMCPRYP